MICFAVVSKFRFLYIWNMFTLFGIHITLNKTFHVSIFHSAQVVGGGKDYRFEILLEIFEDSGVLGSSMDER